MDGSKNPATSALKVDEPQSLSYNQMYVDLDAHPSIFNFPDLIPYARSLSAREPNVITQRSSGPLKVFFAVSSNRSAIC